jgi:Immunity protein 52
MIRIFFEPVSLNLGEIFGKTIQWQIEISRLLGISDWQIETKKKTTPITHENRNEIKEILLKCKKGSIPDWLDVSKDEITFDYVDDVNTSISFRTFNGNLKMTYELGMPTKMTRYSTFFIVDFREIRDFGDTEAMIQLFTKFIGIFNPFKVDYDNRAFLSKQKDTVFETGLSFRTSWLVYLSNDFILPKEVFDSFRTIKFENQGTLIIITEERFDRENPEHQKKAEQLWYLINNNNNFHEFIKKKYPML